MHAKLAELIELLDLEPLERNLFRAFHPADRNRRLYGGQIMAQALMAAARTLTEPREVHSLHGYFLRPGSPKRPALIEVEETRDGRSFSTRRVVVVQNGRAIFNLDVSFQATEAGLEHAVSMPARTPPDPAQISPAMSQDVFLTWRHDHRALNEMSPQVPRQDLWIRANGSPPQDALLHTALLVYESDHALLATARLPHRGRFDRERMQMASLDHAMWFHHPVDVDQWLLYSLESPSTHAARGFSRGHVFNADGLLLASCVQEGLMRVRP